MAQAVPGAALVVREAEGEALHVGGDRLRGEQVNRRVTLARQGREEQVADAGRAEILRELGKLKGAALLRGMRGAPPRDVAAFADVVEKVGALMRENPEIADIDLNPVNVYAQGAGALALDALFVFS